MLPLHWLFPASATLSAGYPVTLEGVLAGAAFGLGARINRSCALGTLAHLTGGNFVNGLTMIGMICGGVSTAFLASTGENAALPRLSPLEALTIAALSVWAVLLLVVSVALHRCAPRWLRPLREAGQARSGPYRAKLVIGVCGGLLYAFAGSWTYMAFYPTVRHASSTRRPIPMVWQW